MDIPPHKLSPPWHSQLCSYCHMSSHQLHTQAQKAQYRSSLDRGTLPEHFNMVNFVVLGNSSLGSIYLASNLAPFLTGGLAWVGVGHIVCPTHRVKKCWTDAGLWGRRALVIWKTWRGEDQDFKGYLQTCRQCPHSNPPSCRWCSSFWSLEIFLHNRPGYHNHISDPPQPPHTYSEVVIFVNILLSSFVTSPSLSPESLASARDKSDMTTEDSMERPGTGGLCSEHKQFHCHSWGYMTLVHIGLYLKIGQTCKTKLSTMKMNQDLEPIGQRKQQIF